MTTMLLSVSDPFHFLPAMHRIIHLDATDWQAGPTNIHTHPQTEQLKETIQSLYQIMVQVSTYDATSSTGTPSHAQMHSTVTSPSSSSRDVLANELRALERSLQAVHGTATRPDPERSLPRVPPELVHYVEGGRNPDIYTREFVELARRGNQLLRGKQSAFASFRDTLAAEIARAMPELRDDAAAAVAVTSGGGAAPPTADDAARASASTATATTAVAASNSAGGAAAGQR